jgi:filamentous hemagglutinin family protein
MTRQAPRHLMMPVPLPRHAAPAASPAAQGFQPKLLAWSLAAAFMVPHAPTAAQPVGAQVIAGQAQFQAQGNNLLVTTQNAPGKQHSAINWQSFNVPAGSTTYFQQPGASSTSINRVTAPNPSAIMGNLGSNGHLVLVNPSGIAVGAGAVVDTARFTAAAMQMTDADALAGRLQFEGGAAVEALGRVLARTGDVVLLAPNVAVQPGALIQAPNGTVLLAAGQKVELVSPGMDGLRFEVQAPADQALNLGTLQGNAVGMFAGSLKHSGQIDVQAVSAEGGKVYLKAVDKAEVDGQTRAQRLDRLGGLFHATAQTMQVGATAKVDASGEAGGGEVLIGGGWQGKDARLANAQTTTVASGAVLDASATAQGQGGTVVAWADDHTTFAGQVLARGGAQGGDGGRVETSGKQTLDARGARVDTRATLGRTGDWLLDPADITIQGGSAPPPPASPSLVYEADLEAATSNVTVSADNSIQVAGAFGGNAIVMQPNVNLTLSVAGPASAPPAPTSGIDLVASSTPIGITTSGAGGITLTSAVGSIKVNNTATSSTLSAGTGGINITANTSGVTLENTTLKFRRSHHPATAASTCGSSCQPILVGVAIQQCHADCHRCGPDHGPQQRRAAFCVQGCVQHLHGIQRRSRLPWHHDIGSTAYGVNLDQCATLGGDRRADSVTGDSGMSGGSGSRLHEQRIPDPNSTGNVTLNAPTGGAVCLGHLACRQRPVRWQSVAPHTWAMAFS